MKRLLWAALSLGLGAGNAQADSGGLGDATALVTKSGDLLQVGLPLVALGLTFLLDEPDHPDQATSEARWRPDGPGWSDDYALHMTGSPRHDLALAVARTELATYSLKYAINAPRPNGGSNSFPSGHTSIAFTGAEFIRKEYGWGWGVPAYLAAGFVGWSRVASNTHYTRDVVAGAALGILSNHDLDRIELPFGAKLGSSLLTMQPVDPATLGLTEADNPNLLEAATPLAGPGLKLEFRFW